jgi:hypothetical protein
MENVIKGLQGNHVIGAVVFLRMGLYLPRVEVEEGLLVEVVVGQA